jgi:hypothetical protein
MLKEDIQVLKEREEKRRTQAVQNYNNLPEIREKMVTRLKIGEACKSKPEARLWAWKLCERTDNSAEGCMFWIENFGWTYNSRMVNMGMSAHIPFFLYEYQRRAIREMIDHIENGRDLLIEKSRDMGVTWLTVYVFLWFWLFRDGINFLLGSYKEALVDNRSDDSMFGRLDYALGSLPKWMLPKGFSPNKHRTKLKLQNPLNYNLISGDTMNPDFGRGSRKTAIFFDELGSWMYAKDAWESCGDVTNCRIANSTPKGANYYYKLRYDGIDVLTLHWHDHPLKDESWYEYECARRTPEEVAQELDISYNKSQEGRVYPEWNEGNVSFAHFEYDDTLPLYVGWDFGKGDDTAIIWSQPKNGRLRIIDTYTRSGKNIDFFVPFVTGDISSENYGYTPTDMDIIQKHKSWKRGVHFGDPAGRNRNQVTDATVLSVLRDAGININYRENWQPFQTRKRATKTLLMRGIDLNKNDMTAYFNMCMENAAYPKVKVEGEDAVRSQKPRHDWSSHYRSALEYLALGLEDYIHKMSKPIDKFKRRERTDRFGRRRSIMY